METTSLKLSNRKYTTEFSKSKVLEFLNSFNFAPYSDLVNITSESFGCTFKPTGTYTVDRAMFIVIDGILKIEYEFDDYHAVTCSLDMVFDGYCSFIDFTNMVNAFRVLVEKVNKQAAKKDAEIESFLAIVAIVDAHKASNACK